MNAETKRWESYFDGAGRRHWRWPAMPRVAAPAGATRPMLLQEAPKRALLVPRVRSR